MRYRRIGVVLWVAQWLLSGCTPIHAPIKNQYTLNEFSQDSMHRQRTSHSITVSQPEALAGYQTEQMYYVQKPFELHAFAHNAWVNPPANMLYPLIIETLEHTHYFDAVSSGVYAEQAEYRLDTQLIVLRQNFLVKPSVLELTIKCTLTHAADQRIVASHIFSERIPCKTNTPYGGVVAANQATGRFTYALSRFVIAEINRPYDKG